MNRLNLRKNSNTPGSVRPVKSSFSSPESKPEESQFLRKSSKKVIKSAINIVTLIIFGVTIYSLRADIFSTLKNIKNADYFVLALIPVLQYYNYTAHGQLLRGVYKIFNTKISSKEALSLALELNFIGFILPTAGVSGVSYLALRMKDRALTSVSATAMGVKVLTQNLAFILFLITGLFVLALSGQASNLLILMASSLSLMIIFAGLIAVYIISSKARIRNSVKWLLDLVNFTANKLKHAKNGILRKLSGQKIEHKARDILDSEKILDRLSRLHDNYLILKRHHRELRRPLGYGILANLTELATIYIVFVANGYWPNPGAIIIGYAVASFAGIVSVVPGGVGLFEALMVGVMVSAGIPAGVSISATVMYRIINTLISMPVGYYLYHKQLNKNAKLNLQTAKTAPNVNDVPTK